MYRKWMKRALDIVFAVLVLTIGLIPMGLISLMIVLESPGPAVYVQERLGKDGKIFRFLKFRSMYRDTEHTGSGVYSDNSDPRVTPFGRFLRASSLDELPQMVNVLKGDMSLIGPRPPLTYHPWPIEVYSEEQKRMFDVRPGLTGWAQVNGRRTVEWNRRIEMSVWYVDHLSFRLDLKIFLMSIFKVLRNENNENTGKTAK